MIALSSLPFRSASAFVPLTFEQHSCSQKKALSAHADAPFPGTGYHTFLQPSTSFSFLIKQEKSAHPFSKGRLCVRQVRKTPQVIKAARNKNALQLTVWKPGIIAPWRRNSFCAATVLAETASADAAAKTDTKDKKSHLPIDTVGFWCHNNTNQSGRYYYERRLRDAFSISRATPCAAWS